MGNFTRERGALITFRKKREPLRHVPISTSHTASTAAFTFTELCVTIVIAVLFGAAAFATNSRLLYALRTQKEATAATMVLQQRMESLAVPAASHAGGDVKDYISSNIFQ